MNDWFSEFWHWLIGVFLAAFSAVGWMIKRQINRLDQAEDNIEELRRDHVSRQELSNLKHDIKADIKRSEEHIVTRIDDLYTRLNNRQ